MTNKKRFGSGLRDQLRIHQAFAARHYYERLLSPRLVLPTNSPVCGNPLPNPPLINKIPCPMCGVKKPFDEMSVEHGPQQGGQSQLGTRVVAVLSCRTCNNNAGADYESLAAQWTPGDELAAFTPQELAEFKRQHAEMERLIDMHIATRPLEVELTDIKAAFTIAFATLGYRFALAPELRDIRDALTKPKSATEPDPRQVMGIELKDGAPATGGIVLEVRYPAPCIIVASATGAGVIMPMPGHATIPPASMIGKLNARRYTWPDTAAHAKVNEVERAYRMGNLFHADLCHPHQLP